MKAERREILIAPSTFLPISSQELEAGRKEAKMRTDTGEFVRGEVKDAGS